MNGIQLKYSTLLSLSVQQLFYQNKIAKQSLVQANTDINFIPTQNCIDVLKRMNLVFKNTDANAGFTILARVSGTNGSGSDVLRFAPRKEDALIFLMMLKNTDALNFNKLPLQPDVNSIYLFSNDVADAAATRDNLHISKNATGVDGAVDTIKKSGVNYRFHSATTIAANTAKVKHFLTGLLLDPVSLVTKNGKSDISFDLSALPVGKCNLLVNNLPVDEFYYLGAYATQPVLGVIELSLAQTLPANYRIIEPDMSLNAAKPFYTITFLNRKTFWRYTVRLQNTSPLFLEMTALPDADKAVFISKLNIVSNDTAIAFNLLPVVSDYELIFESTNKVLLHEKYFSSSSLTHNPLTLTLKKYIGNINLPVEADIKNFFTLSANQQHQCISITKNLFRNIYNTLN